MEYILLVVFWVQAQGWSVATAEFGDQAACESAKRAAASLFNDTAREAPSGGTAGRAVCVPKHTTPAP